MAGSTNVGTVSFKIEIDNRAQIRRLVRDTLGEAQQEANQMANSINQSTNKASKGFTSMAKSIGLVTVAALALRKAFNFGKESISLASDLQEVQNVVDVTFGNMSSRVNEFSKTAMESIGLSELVAKKYMGSFGAMSKAFGYSTEEAYNMSEALTMLAGDVSSFYNLSSDEAYTKLKSVFTGETESLKDLGVVMTQAALDSFALEQGFGKTTKAMSEQEKVMLRYQFVMNRLALAQGDFVRTQDGWANQTRVLKLRFDELKATIGEGLILALTPVVKMLNLIISKLIVAAQAFTSFIKNLFGIKEDEGGTAQLAEDMNNAGTAAFGVAAGAEKTAKSIAKAKKQLMGFDKLYQLSSNSGSDSDAGIAGGGIGDVGAIGGSKVDIGSGITLPSASELGKKLSDFAIGILKGLREKLAGVDWNSVGRTIGDFLSAIDWVPIFTEVVKLMFTALSSAAKIYKGVFDAAPIETAIISGLLLMKFTGLGGLIMGKISKAIVAKLGGESGATVGGAIIGWLGKAIKGINFKAFGKFFGGIGMLVGGAITAVKNFVDMFINGFSWIKEALMVVGLALGAVGAVILGAPALVASIVAAIIAAVASLVVVIKDNWTAIANFFKNAGTFIANWFSNLVTSVTGFMSKIGTGIKNAWVSVTSWFSAKLTAFKDGFINTFVLIKNGILNVFNTIKTAIKAPFNAVIGMLNKLIDGINSLSFEIPNWVPGSMAGKKLGFNIPRIPALAEGGYVKPNNPRLAIIGDNKREGEIVAPESKITAAVNEALIPLVNAISNTMRAPQTAGAAGDIVIPIYLGNDLIDQYIVNANNRNTFRSGR